MECGMNEYKYELELITGNVWRSYVQYLNGNIRFILESKGAGQRLGDSNEMYLSERQQQRLLEWIESCKTDK
jgi:hypothetical protein